MELVLNSGSISAKINYHGAELKSLNKNGKEYMWQADPAYWNRTSPVLFPFVGQVANGVYRHNGNEYKMGQHGFARDMDFELLSSSDDSCEFVLRSNEETKTKYPFDFELFIGYKLNENGIDVTWKVKNTGDGNLEFSIGAHPAFNCSLNETSLRISKDNKPLDCFVNAVFGKGLLTDKTAIISLDNGVMELDESSFDGDAFVIENGQTDKVEILNKDGKVELAVLYETPLVGIWSPPKKNAPFLCIEPWFGRADKEGYNGELRDREWNNTLKPSEAFNTTYKIIV